MPLPSVAQVFPPPVYKVDTMSEPRDLFYCFPLMRGEDVRAVQKALTTLGVQPLVELRTVFLAMPLGFQWKPSSVAYTI